MLDGLYHVGHGGCFCDVVRRAEVGKGIATPRCRGAAAAARFGALVSREGGGFLEREFLRACGFSDARGRRGFGLKRHHERREVEVKMLMLKLTDAVSRRLRLKRDEGVLYVINSRMYRSCDVYLSVLLDNVLLVSFRLYSSSRSYQTDSGASLTLKLYRLLPFPRCLPCCSVSPTPFPLISLPTPWVA